MAVFEQEAIKTFAVNLLWLNTLNYTVQVTISDYVYLQATGEEVDKSWRDMVDQLEVGCSVC